MRQIDPMPDTSWPHAAIARLRGETLEGLEFRAAHEQRRQERFMRHLRRCMVHEERFCHSGDVNVSHDVYEYFGDLDYLDDLHVWTMRVLRGARRAAARQ